jgi:dihydrofolate synthase / folylpolyglutamate synthase
VSLQQSLEALYGLERRRDKLGLDGTRALLGALGDPHSEWASVHVAGTNGKGSVCAMIERVLREGGIRTGLFTSPHLVDFRERIRVDGQWADEERLRRRLALVQKLPEGHDRTFFEVCTALAFDDFAAREAEWAVVEVGLGGRLDSTNVIESSLAVITSIGTDHVEVLGRTPAEIALEKAGIIKPEVPVVSGVAPGEAADVIARAARRRDAPLVRADRRVTLRSKDSGPDGIRFVARVEPWGELELTCPLHGHHQLANARTALAALSEMIELGVELEAEAVVEGFARVRWPGRLESAPSEPRLWWDGAHNPEGMAALRRAWNEDLGLPPPAALVLALSRDKDAEAIGRALADWGVARAWVTRTRNLRAMPAAEARAGLARGGLAGEESASVAGALDAALGAAGDDRVLLAGSLYAVAEAMEAWGGAPGEWL